VVGPNGGLGHAQVLPWLPKPQQDRLEAMIERELTKRVRRAESAHEAKRSKRLERPDAAESPLTGPDAAFVPFTATG
jgi:hypothetical protein